MTGASSGGFAPAGPGQLEGSQNGNLRHYNGAAAFLGSLQQAARCNPPVILLGFLLWKAGDVLARITQGAQSFAFGERNWLVEFEGPGHRAGVGEPQELCLKYGAAVAKINGPMWGARGRQPLWGVRFTPIVSGHSEGATH